MKTIKQSIKFNVPRHRLRCTESDLVDRLQQVKEAGLSIIILTEPRRGIKTQATVDIFRGNQIYPYDNKTTVLRVEGYSQDYAGDDYTDLIEKGQLPHKIGDPIEREIAIVYTPPVRGIWIAENVDWKDPIYYDELTNEGYSNRIQPLKFNDKRDDDR